jgi:Domain of unknown function (DUF4919)
MKTKFITLIVCFLTLTTFVRAQNTSIQQTELTKKETSVKAPYAELLKKLQTGDTNVDYKALRTAFVETKEYSYGGLDKDVRNKMFKSLNDKKYKDSLKQAEKILEKNYLEINAHYVAYISNKELKDDKKTELHKTIMVNLLEAIRNGNDGLSAKTAFMPITIDEEYTLMNFLGYKHSSQSLQSIEGHQFDVFEVVDSKTKEAKKLYFNIDVIWKAETAIFSK